ncbi:MAG: polyprenyl synthetase family protein, partial [archaeon]|nr:polyprenyl synthetase family protein [archaeon]
LRTVTSAVWDLARGQQMDISNENNVRTVALEEYVETIRLKTGALFSASAVGGALIGGANDLVIEAIRKYATFLGVAFQIFDDVLGIVGDPKKTGKSAGNDIRRGKCTAITCHAIKSIKDEKERETFYSIFGKADGSEEEISVVRSVFEKYGSIEYAVKLAKEYAGRAISELNFLDPSREKDIMVDFAKYAVSRGV